MTIWTLEDIYIGLFKACVFGMIIAIIGCYQGFNTQGGAEGVGKATTRAVVMSSLLILIANYFITACFFNGPQPLGKGKCRQEAQIRMGFGGTPKRRKWT